MYYYYEKFGYIPTNIFWVFDVLRLIGSIFTLPWLCDNVAYSIPVLDWNKAKTTGMGYLLVVKLSTSGLVLAEGLFI